MPETIDFGLGLHGVRDDGGTVRLELRDLAAVEKALGRRLLAAFVRAFNGAERLSATFHFTELNREHAPRPSTLRKRNTAILIFLLFGALYEAQLAIDMILLEGVEDHVEKANRHLRDLKAIRDRWKKNPLLKTSRDEIGHHLGNHAAFVKGLGRFNDGETLTLIERSTPSATSHRYPAAIETLLRGLAIDQSEFLTFATSATKDATAMLIVLERLFFDALASHGASVEIRAFMHRR